MSCHFHGPPTYDDIAGVRTPDGLYLFECTEPVHPDGHATYEWLADLSPAAADGLGGLADELSLGSVLPELVAGFGGGWYEYGLVEKRYAETDPDGFDEMVRRWGHTARESKPYTASSYLAGTLGRLAREGAVAFRYGAGTGRWDYNSQISYWAVTPDADWDSRTTWVATFGDDTAEAKAADEICKAYVR
ncbi:hypothetical protein [Marmoricola sp. OAE513]|uniref:hypothetical protein n=1 Tax=Marmoricola sp. OAE513 TaxID=2817894 RepID=UPI001AE5D775